MARTAQISKEKHQSIFTLSFFKCSCKNHQALWWNWLSWGPPQESISSLELPASEIAAQINASHIWINRHTSTSTIQRRLRESGLRGQIAAKKSLLEDTENKKRLSWAKKHEQWTLDRWKSVLSVWWVQIWDFWFQPRCLCETQSRWTDDLCMCSSHREAWRRRCDGVGVLCWWHCLWFI